MFELIGCFLSFVFFLCFVMCTVYLSGIRSDTDKIVRYIDTINKKVK